MNTIASEKYTELGVTEPFKTWISKQPGFEKFMPFFGKLPDGKLGRDYRLTPEQAAMLRPSTEGQRSIYWFMNNRGVHYDAETLCLIGQKAGALCQEQGIATGVKFQHEVRPDGSRWRGRVRLYPIKILEALKVPDLNC